MKLALGLLIIAAVGAGQVCAEDAPAYIGGMAPDHRREDVPIVKAAQAPDKNSALRGIDQPPPASLESVVEDQGAWYTPFTRPGMTGRYDIRKYHEARSAAH